MVNIRSNLVERLPTLLLSAASLAFLAAVWLIRPDASGEFPKAMQDGLGLLLAALVFVLGFARAEQERISATALDTFRRHHDALLGAWMAPEPSTFQTCDLLDLALRRVIDASGFSRLAANWSRGNRDRNDRRLVRLSLQRQTIRADSEQLEYLLAYRQEVVKHAKQREADSRHEVPDLFKPESDKEFARLQGQIPRIEADLERVTADRRELDEAAGVGTAELVTGPARIRLAVTTDTLLQNAARFVSGMALLYAAGIIYATPSMDLLGSPELWVATLVMIVALTYVRLVTRAARDDLLFTAETIDRMPLVALARMDLSFNEITQLPANEASKRAVDRYKRHGWWLLRQVEVQAPGLTWTASVRGRFELAQGIATGTNSVQQERERQRHLQLAALHLQQAKDDPMALIALGRTHEELGDSAAVAPFVDAAVERLQGRSTWVPGEGWDRAPTVTHLVEGQWWLWPHDRRAVELLAGATERQHIDDEGDDVE